MLLGLGSRRLSDFNSEAEDADLALAACPLGGCRAFSAEVRNITDYKN